MKKIVLILVGISTLFTSCKDFLNLTPKNTRVVYSMEDVRKTMSTFLYATQNTQVNGVSSNYIRFNDGILVNPYNKYGAVMGSFYANDIDMLSFFDEEIASQAQTRSWKSYEIDYNGAKDWKGNELSERLWQRVFHNVGYLNAVLRDLSKVPDYNTIDGERVKGEARVIRAYYLLRLNQLFAPYDNVEFGIPFNLDADIFTGGARYNQVKLYRILIGELEDVLKYTTPPKIGWNMYYNKRIIYAILAQTYLFKAESCAKESTDWENAKKFAILARDGQRIESDASEQASVAICPDDKVFETPGQFCLLRYNSPSDRAVSGSNNYSPWGHPDTRVPVVSEELYNMYDANDIRLDVFFKEQRGRMRIEKTAQSTRNVDGYSFIHVLFRYSEMMLIEAEACVRLGDTQGALALLNEFKSAKIPGYAGYKGNDILEEILRERRKEFCYEEQMNWLDMKRTGVRVTRKSINRDKNVEEEHTLQATDYRYALPIPTSLEGDYNSNLTQNPGWL